MKFNNIILISFVSFSLSFFAQGKGISVFSTSKEMFNTETKFSGIKSLRLALWSDSIVLVSQDKNKIKLDSKSVWGYQSKGAIIYRIYKNDFYKISQADSLSMCIYTKKSGKYTKYYFSKSADSEILPLYKSILKQNYSTNQCFIQKIENELKWYEDPNVFEKSSGTYRIINFLKDCQKK
jgi:hypothetical protein